MLQKLNFAPGFNKQVTATGGEMQWVSGDYVRFRYGSPEKIGGWSQLGDVTLTGRTVAMHQFVNASGIKYSALGTNRILYVYSGGAFYDITPIKATTTLTNAFTTTNGSTTVTITFASAHGITAGDIILLDNFTAITDSNFSSGDFDDYNFMVTTVPSATTITVTMGSAESGSGATTSGGIRVRHYYSIGPAVEESAAGFGLGLWGGVKLGVGESTLDGALTNSSTSIVLDDSASFPATRSLSAVSSDDSSISMDALFGPESKGADSARSVSSLSCSFASRGALSASDSPSDSSIISDAICVVELSPDLNSGTATITSNAAATAPRTQAGLRNEKLDFSALLIGITESELSTIISFKAV